MKRSEEARGRSNRCRGIPNTQLGIGFPTIPLNCDRQSMPFITSTAPFLFGLPVVIGAIKLPGRSTPLEPYVSTNIRRELQYLLTAGSICPPKHRICCMAFPFARYKDFQTVCGVCSMRTFIKCLILQVVLICASRKAASSNCTFYGEEVGRY